MASEHTPSSVRVAAVQAEGCYFDLPAAVEKTGRLIAEAASKGCDMIAFPEVWIPMYPGWIGLVVARFIPCHQIVNEDTGNVRLTLRW